ncbi:MAG: heterodisulfide reductase-related iron-sulfur binding cluster [Chloroflexota bacterium]
MFESFAHVPFYPLVFPIFWGGFAVFALIVMRHARVWMAVKAMEPRALRNVPRRAWGVVQYSVLQTRMFTEPDVAIMHFGLFLGSTILLIGNINFVTGGVPEAIFSWPLDGVVWAFLLGLQNVMAVAALSGVAYALYRRLVVKPKRLSGIDTRVHFAVLAFITAVVSTEFVAQWFEAAAFGPIDGAFISNFFGGFLANLGHDATNAVFVVLWWAHVFVLAAFLMFVPTNKHFHIYTSFVNTWLRKLEPRGQLPMMDLEREDATFGLRTLADLGWKDVFDGFTCTECGRCTSQCPANRTGKVLDPRALIMGIREMSKAAEAGIDLIPNSPGVQATYGLSDAKPKDQLLLAPIVGNAISYEAVWDCVTCGACVEACPVTIEHVDKIVGLRRNLVLEDSKFPNELTPAFRGMESVANPWGQPPSARLDWTKGLPFTVRTAEDVKRAGELDQLEVLYWVGCAAAFDDRNRRVARAVATCLDAAGISFAVLGQEEACTGDPARRMGNEYVFQMLASQNIETLNKYKIGERTIITACPHCFNSIGNEYTQMGGNFKIRHHSEFLADLVRKGRLVIDRNGQPSRTITYHDSCYLARYNGVMAAPRDVIGSIPGVELVEMTDNMRQTMCCGGGGGRMWMEENVGTRIQAARTDQVIATGAGTIATACPFCMVMLRDGVAEAGRGQDTVDPIISADISELLADALAPAPVIADRAVPEGRRLNVL